MVCSLNCSMLQPNLVLTGTMDGKIKFWDIGSGEVEKVLVVNDGPIVELLVLEREAKPGKIAFTQIILCCYLALPRTKR